MIQEATKTMTYTAYRSMIDELLANNKTTGNNHSEDMIGYTQMNVHRMNKWDKTLKISDDLVDSLAKLNRKIKLVTFTEAWCGDAAHNVPVIEKVFQSSDNIVSHELLLRDENEKAFSNYLFNDTKSIPRTVFFDAETGEELATWGPRPTPAQTMVEENKKTQELDYPELNKKLQLWYAKDKSITMQIELLELLSQF